MAWFSDRIDLNFKIYCLHCGYSFYPYCENWAFGKVPRQVFDVARQRSCPECGRVEWGRNF